MDKTTNGCFVSYTTLNVLGAGAVVVSALGLGGSHYVTDEIGMAFCLGASAIALLGAVVMFGFVKRRQQTV
jgi:hypothetical protein